MGFSRVFIANRAEVAVRVARTCDRLGITPVFGASTVDAEAPYLKGREVVVLGPGRAADSYLNIERVVQAAAQSGCAAVHPGWGFLAESALFASLCEAHGLRFIGPPAQVIERMGDKIPAKQAMRAAGLPVIPGSEGALSGVEEAEAIAAELGYPVILKAARGGGGRGMRIANAQDELQAAFQEAQAEAQAAFSDGRLYLERLVQAGRHIEVQLLADRYGAVVHLGERDCTVQRKHQKLIEESPSPVLAEEQRQACLQAAVRAAEAIGYVGAGTVEFLLGPDGALSFMEMNTRLQVEHPVSEARCGLDLVEAQLRVAAGERLWIAQDDLQFGGHAIECRINAEDPAQGFAPAPGKITRWRPPSGEGVRVDSHVCEGYEIPPQYDSLLCKIICHGSSREQAVLRMRQALSELVCEGVPTTASMHAAILDSEAFSTHDYDTGRLPGWPPAAGALSVRES